MQFRNQGEPIIAQTYFRNVPGLLLAFVVLSTLAHGLTFLFTTEPALRVNDHRFGATIISTVLTPAKDEPAASPTRSTASAPQSKEKVDNSQPLTKAPEIIKTTKVSSVSVNREEARTTATKNSETKPLKPQSEPSIRPTNKPITTARVSTNNSNPSTTESPATQLETQRNYLLGELQNRLSRYLTYPQRARRRGWQGQVMIAFNINTHGQLNNVRLAQSSGYSLLDRSAIAAIDKLGHIALPEKLGPLRAMELLMPVHYQLREG